MPIENRLVHCEPDDPARCQHGGRHQQCPFLSHPPSLYCSRHGAVQDANRQEKANIRNYRLAKWQARMEEFADSPQVKSLREEIAILRMCLEETLNKCKDAEELFIMSHKISDLVVKVEKLVVSCHKLESATGQLLDKSAALTFAGQIVMIIGNHVKDEIVLDTMTDQILKSLTALTVDASAPESNGD
jgi:trehalose-6-phosphatase